MPLLSSDWPRRALRLPRQDQPWVVRITNVRFVRTMNVPAAKTTPPPGEEAPSSRVLLVPWFGLSTTFHAEPSHWRVMVCSRPPWVKSSVLPTAHTSVGEFAVTPVRKLFPLVEGSGF